MRISFQQFLLEHAPKGTLLSQRGLCEPLQLCNEVFKRAALKSTQLLCSLHFPATPQACPARDRDGKCLSQGLESHGRTGAPFPTAWRGERMSWSFISGTLRLPIGPSVQVSNEPMATWALPRQGPLGLPSIPGSLLVVYLKDKYQAYEKYCELQPKVIPHSNPLILPLTCQGGRLTSMSLHRGSLAWLQKMQEGTPLNIMQSKCY